MTKETGINEDGKGKKGDPVIEWGIVLIVAVIIAGVIIPAIAEKVALADIEMHQIKHNCGECLRDYIPSMEDSNSIGQFMWLDAQGQTDPYFNGTTYDIAITRCRSSCTYPLYIP